MKFLYRFKNTVCTEITVDYKTETVEIVNHTDNLMRRAFGVNEHPSFKDWEEFLEYRCFERSADGMKLRLRELGLDHYDPYEIVLKTEGRLEGDKMSLIKVG